MTAEIAILNKSAIALATDSVVTITSGNKHDKTYDTADKLFELSCRQPLGIMVYNGMTFMDMPLPPMIKEFRDQCGDFACVEDAAKAFLEFLNSEGRKSDESVLRRAIHVVIAPYLATIQDRYRKRLVQQIRPSDPGPDGKPTKIDLNDFQKRMAGLLGEIIRAHLGAFKKLNDASFIGPATKPRFTQKIKKWVEEYIDADFMPVEKTERDDLIELCQCILLKDHFSPSMTGLIICGFGINDRFPTLVSYDIDGIICGRLKYRMTEHCDIDRKGPKAAVLPYAQKDMVDRFVFGIDDKIKSDIQRYCRETVTQALKSVVTAAGAENDAGVTKKADAAEKAFSEALNQKVFESIRDRSRKEIEDMVEFMPKPEMARMAEALVELTSIKRRVSRGFETVGGPIDVAVISKAEGFTWVKRKLYFPPEINSRYFERIRKKMEPSNGGKP